VGKLRNWLNPSGISKILFYLKQHNYLVQEKQQIAVPPVRECRYGRGPKKGGISHLAEQETATSTQKSHPRNLHSAQIRVPPPKNASLPTNLKSGKRTHPSGLPREQEEIRARRRRRKRRSVTSESSRANQQAEGWFLRKKSVLALGFLRFSSEPSRGIGAAVYICAAAAGRVLVPKLPSVVRESLARWTVQILLCRSCDLNYLLKLIKGLSIYY
jgi:hypothetical protein